ncbi:MAG: hypothetical protein FWE71_13560 [Nocardioidaceae bacterium]|nr:hypothetical protein [Nocardioidaceae bacterium]MCL2614209.1 hypothetical protein [Nocardioidaceae bacterium]
MNDDAPSPATAPDSSGGDVPEPPRTAFDPDPAPAAPPPPVDPSAAPADGSTMAEPSDEADGSDGDGAGGAGTGRVDTDFPTAPTKGGLTGALVAIGSGLLGAAVVISALRSRHNGDLHVPTYVVGLVATALLLGLALMGAAGIRRRTGGQARDDLVTWPGTVGILATAPMIAVGLGQHMHGDEAYLLGGVITVLALVGYVLARRPAFVVVAIVGLGMLYARGFDDVVGNHFQHQSGVVVATVAITVFVVAVTILGWFLPSRAISGVAVGAFGLVGVAGGMAALLAEREVGALMSRLGGMAPMASGSLGQAAKLSSNPADYSNDVGWLFGMTAILTVLWALAALVSDHSGFKVLTVALPALAVPLGTTVLIVQHPSIWGIVLGVVGALLVLLATAVARRKARAVDGV